MAEVLFAMTVYPKTWDDPKCNVPDDKRIPLRLAVCNLYKAERMNAYPGAGVWDVNKTTGMAYCAYPVEFGLLQEKLIHLTIRGMAGDKMTRLCRFNHQSTRARGRNWRMAPTY